MKDANFKWSNIQNFSPTEAFDACIYLLNIYKENLIEWTDSWEKIDFALDNANGKPAYIGPSDIGNLLNGYRCLHFIMVCKLIINGAGRTKEKEKKHTRWTEEDDNKLIELATTEGMSPQLLSNLMERTPGSVQNRLSKLVGVKRDSKPVDGIFKGIMQTNEDGSADICGRVFDR